MGPPSEVTTHRWYCFASRTGTSSPTTSTPAAWNPGSSTSAPRCRTWPKRRENDVSTLSLVQTRPDGGRRAILIVNLLRGLSVVVPSGDELDPWLLNLLDSGWTLATNESAHPPRARGWKLDLDRTTGQGRITSTKSTGVFLDQLPSLHPDWVDLAARQQEVTVFATRDIVDLTTVAEQTKTDGAAPVQQALQDAARAGNLIAARIKVVSRSSKPAKSRPSREDEARRTVAEALENALNERARPGQPAGTGLNARPDLIPLPARPRLTETVIGDFCVLVVDLATPAPQQDEATRVLTTLKSAGFKPMRTFEDGPLAMPPKGWNYVLWKSQVLVMTPDDTKFIFEPLRPTGDWYERVRKSKQGALGLLVGNLDRPYNDDDPNSFAKALRSAMTAGNVVGCALQGMLAQ